MSSKKIVVVSIVLIFIAILIFALGFFKDKSDSFKAMKVIRHDYKIFEDDVVSFNEMRDSIYEHVFSDGYFDSFLEHYEGFNQMFHDYEKRVNLVQTHSSNLIVYCDDIYYTEAVVNTMCSRFADSYEELFNSFVRDVKNYNTLIKEYNHYVKESGSKDTLSFYKTKKKYIDYNHDKKYDGKE